MTQHYKGKHRLQAREQLRALLVATGKDGRKAYMDASQPDVILEDQIKYCVEHGAVSFYQEYVSADQFTALLSFGDTLTSTDTQKG